MTAGKNIISAEEIAALTGERKVHFLNPNAIRINKSLGDLTGLRNIGFHIIEIEPGHESTEYHAHYYEEECVYILAGEATVTIADEHYPVKAGDFIGYPLDGHAHTMRNTGSEKLICIVVGQRLQQDVADYPHLGKRLYRRSGQWDLVDIADISKPK